MRRTRLLCLCTLCLGDVHLAEDAVQDAFFCALRSPWRKRRAATEALEGCTVPDPEPAGDTLARAVMDLSPKYRSVVALYYYQEWSIREPGSVHCDNYISNYWRFLEAVGPEQVIGISIGQQYIPPDGDTAGEGYWLEKVPE